MENAENTVVTAPESIFARLARAQAKFNPVVKNQKNGGFNSKYADLQSVIDAVRPALNAEGIFFFQTISTDKDMVGIETHLASADGEQISSGIAWTPVGGKKDAQAFGSAETYGRRYQLAAFLGVAQEDDDGNSASGVSGGQKQQPRQLPETLKQEALEAAKNGLTAYGAFFAGIKDKALKRTLSDSEFHKEMKALAEGCGE